MADFTPSGFDDLPGAALGPPAETCWICGSPFAQTREHRSKASDIKGEFGTPTRSSPFYFHEDSHPGGRARRNVPVGSLKSKVLKFSHRICQTCNSERTQPYDYAWESASSKLRAEVPRLTQGGAFRANWLFQYNARAAMRCLHLFFVKLFGCQIVEGKIAIDTKPFAAALIDGRAQSDVFLTFGRMAMPVDLVGSTDVHADLREDGQVAFASWFYQVGELSVNVLYAPEDQRRTRPAVNGAWHPTRGCQRIAFIDFDARGA